MAKEPRPGSVKTRLIPVLGERGAADLSRAFVHDSVELCTKAAQRCAARTFLFYDPPASKRRMRDFITRDVELRPQGPGTLGDRLIDAYAVLAAERLTCVCFVGADSPTLPSSYIVDAFGLLERGDVDIVIGPADDGGYYLIGLRSAHRMLFENIGWGSDRVRAQTIACATAAHLRIALLPPWYDVDDRAGLERLRRDIVERDAARRTRAALGHLGVLEYRADATRN